ncbi:hypothetical protein HNY73_002962 [Argiope bruennichi]|uniref:Uncharacterized protein n=1 Tax=Argiope bruennichi TaxID=94029 RepID=A0A8T0FZJ7_ARGBR|nr:hypothetical protein HNY73_002962 [Argiope bruennichi]
MRKESERGRRNLWTRGVEAIPVVMATPAHSNGPGMEDISMGHRRRGNIRAMSVLFERLFLRPGSVLSHCNAQELRVGMAAGWEGKHSSRIERTSLCVPGVPLWPVVLLGEVPTAAIFRLRG